MPLAEDLQNILIQELLTLKPASETGIDTMYNGIERITDLYVKVGPIDDLSETVINSSSVKDYSGQSSNSIGPRIT